MITAFSRKQTFRAESGATLSILRPDICTKSSKTCEKPFVRGRKQHVRIMKASLASSVSNVKMTVRASSASPRPCSSARRTLGVSVAFESALPTQIWQASPNPSPPLTKENSTRCSGRMVSSVSNERKVFLHDRRISKRLHNARITRHPLNEWISDVEMDGSSDDTDCSFAHNLSESSNSSNNEYGTDSKCHNIIASSSTTTGTTDSNSSLDIQSAQQESISLMEALVPMSLDHELKEREYSTRNEYKRRAAIANDASSSSTTSDEDLEAMGWDEKTILALVNRGKGRSLQAHALHSQAGQQILSDVHSLPSSSSKTNTGHKNRRFATGSQTHALPLKVERDQHTQVYGPVIHPNSCVLSRRDRGQLSRKQLLYRNNSYGGPKSISQNMISDVLAIVLQSYKPPSGWEQEYNVLSVRRGDYVSVLNQLGCNAIWGKMLSSNAIDNPPPGLNLKEKCESPKAYAWVYVRRWCVDHLVSTGPPGYIPAQYCKPLSEVDALNLWQRSLQRKVFQRRLMSVHTYASKKSTDVSERCTIHQPFDRFELSELSFDLSKIDIQPISQREKCKLHQLVPQRIPSNQYSIGDSDVSPRETLLYDPSGLPPPPPGFGSGGSIGSETEDKDSGRGPSSGSEWSSGRGCSSNTTLNSATVDRMMILEKPNGLCSDKQAEDSRIKWNSRQCPVFSGDHNSAQEDDGVHFQRYEIRGSSANEEFSQQLVEQTVQLPKDTYPNRDQSSYFPVSIALSTCVNCKPVLSLKANGTSTSVATGVHGESRPMRNESTINPGTFGITDMHLSDREVNQVGAENCIESACWEPYKTVIHVKENTLEKFTLV
ncbi:unnamed protein product [Dicrocoelium dendriticum]|nr:unnamed protein product [Dicrocoelium dendriticum]